MYKNLEAEMTRKGISKKDLAVQLKIPYTTLLDKFKGESRFWFDEALQIKQEVFPELSVEYLFEASEKKKETQEV